MAVKTIRQEVRSLDAAQLQMLRAAFAQLQQQAGQGGY
jgi:hypothetical protein